MNEVAIRLEKLRTMMKKDGVTWFFATSDDYHGSEYVADFFKVREHYTGFTGENAFLMLNDKSAYMWTDGRFFIQAEKELAGSGVTLMKMGEPGVPSFHDFIKANVKSGETFAFDGRMVTTGTGLRIEQSVKNNGARIMPEYTVAGDIWEGRPSMPVSHVFTLGDDIVGENTDSKLSRIREEISKAGAKEHFLGSLDDIAWITNMRGADIECNPVFLAYMIISSDEATVFMEKEEASCEIVSYLSSKGIKVEDYDNILAYLKNHTFSGKVYLDASSVNFACYKAIASNAEIINKMNPSKRMKAVKNDVEVERLKDAYLKDSVCVTKFIYWLKHTIGKEPLTEIKASDYLDNLRRKVPGFLDLSFPTISGYGSNGAIVHYSATPESDAPLKPEGMLLVDSGGQYESGTTDVTRTISLGPVTDAMKLHYTKTAIGMLSLAKARFLYGCTGRNLDILSRAPLWNLGVDFKHGTGHGIGYILNVHEGPQNIRWKFIEGMVEYPIEAGMITSDEPGVYIEGQYGIRIENVILCEKDVENEYGQFLKFCHLTYAPLDRELLDKSVMSENEIEMVNEYQQTVFERMKDFLNPEEVKWLKEVTKKL